MIDLIEFKYFVNFINLIYNFNDNLLSIMIISKIAIIILFHTNIIVYLDSKNFI